MSNINGLPGASSNEMRRQAGPYDAVPATSAPFKGGADNSYKLRNGSSIQLQHQTHSTGSRPGRRAQETADSTFYRKGTTGAEFIYAATEAPNMIYSKNKSHPMATNKSSGVMLAIDQQLGQRVGQNSGRQ